MFLRVFKNKCQFLKGFIPSRKKFLGGSSILSMRVGGYENRMTLRQQALLHFSLPRHLNG